jgi:cellulose synthase/poly-beta-1,6-N-acetylglucosamine synthase-like glycosyltransferase
MLDLILILLLAPLGLLALFVLLEAVAALAPVRARPASGVSGPRPRTAVLIPAHNEASGLAQTLRALAPELRVGDRVLVVADNCDDQTSAIARAEGADVIERHDPSNRGKGHALNAGLAHLARGASPTPEVVVFLDADCRFLPGTMDPLVRTAFEHGRPAQACNLVEVPANPSPKDQLSAFAFLFKNLVRPLGLARLGLPCLLTGTGMAMPWAIVGQVSASGALTEDIQLGIDLAQRGWAPIYVPTSHVRSAAPSGERAASVQRTRWEHGHVQSILRHAPGMFAQAVRRLSPGLFFLGLELTVPPLSLMVLLTLVAWSASTVAYAAGLLTLVPVIASGGIAACVALAVIVGWIGHGRRVVPLTTLIRTPLYVVWKIPIYLRLVTKPEREWVRTEREP